MACRKVLTVPLSTNSSNGVGVKDARLRRTQ